MQTSRPSFHTLLNHILSHVQRSGSIQFIGQQKFRDFDRQATLDPDLAQISPRRSFWIRGAIIPKAVSPACLKSDLTKTCLRVLGSILAIINGVIAFLRMAPGARLSFARGISTPFPEHYHHFDDWSSEVHRLNQFSLALVVSHRLI